MKTALLLLLGIGSLTAAVHLTDLWLGVVAQAEHGTVSPPGWPLIVAALGVTGAGFIAAAVWRLGWYLVEEHGLGLD